MKRIELLICMLFLSLMSMGQGYLKLDLSMNPDTIKVDGARGYVTLYYRSESVLDKEYAIDQLNSFLQQQSQTWLCVEDIVFFDDPLEGMLLVRVEENLSGKSRFAGFLSWINYRVYFVHQYLPGTLPANYNVSGSSTIYPGKKTVVTLSGSEPGVTYELYKYSSLETSLPGTGGELHFMVTEEGLYTIKAVKGNVIQNMEGNASITYYPVLFGRLNIDDVSVSLSNDGEVRMIPFTMSPDYPQGIEELRAITTSCSFGESVLWDSTFVLRVAMTSGTNGIFVVGRGPNIRDSECRSILFLDLETPALEVSQLPGGNIHAYTLSGGGEISSGQTGTLTLSGLQVLVKYDLYYNDDLQETYTYNQFTGLTRYGRYRVKATYDGREVWMLGTPGVWPSITRYAVSGGGVVQNNNPVAVTLAGSQTSLDYRLIQNNVVVASLSGTGGALSFDVREPGVYKIEGGMQDYFVEMSNSVSVSSVSGIYYTPSRNYMAEKVYLEATPTGDGARSASNVTYFDGFGRKLQEIQVCGSPGGTSDIIVPHVYGAQGRVEKEYLPYSKASNYGNFDANAMNSSNWNYYEVSDAPNAFSLTEYDNSPLNRVLKRTGPGKNWHEQGKGVTTTYGTNTSGEVRLYRVDSVGSLIYDNTYLAGTLRKETVTDEDGCRMETFTDNNGQVVLMVQIESDDRLETYSVRDDRGLLRWVLSPEVSHRLGTSVNATELARLAYRYDYDSWGRLIEKRLPGCDPVYMVYDVRDRLVMSQDGKQRSENVNKWGYSLYDKQDRVIETGEVITTGITRSALQAAASASANYTPPGTRSPLQYTLYDNYTATSTVPVVPFQSSSGYVTDYNKQVVGLVTSLKTRVMGAVTEKWLTTTTYYDDRCRVIQTASENLQGQVSRVDLEYDFTGNVTRCRESHGVAAGQADVVESVNAYDDRGRLVSAITSLNGGTSATVTYGYDAVGRQTSRTTGEVTEMLTYNTRGWLTGKESEPFRMRLRYESPEGGSRACWNGNISEWEWQHGENKAFMYGFAYDRVNRLTGTRQKQKNGMSWDTLQGHYLEKGISYDFNGNIKTLQRTALGSHVDDLVYVYTGNQLTGLTENARTSPEVDVYLPGSVATGSYAYDKNGNMVNDSRRALVLSYNLLNLLSEVKTATGALKARYTYSGDGTKLRVRDDGEVNGFDYMGSLTYRKSGSGLKLESASFGEGMIRVTGSNGGGQEVDYFLKDHLGSVRVIVDGNGEVQERNDYYPFGARHVNKDHAQLAANRCKYNGKEEQVTGDLKYLDYGARMFDSGLGRWFGMDPKSEKYYNVSPYNYCDNNSIVYFDPNGEEKWRFVADFTGTTGKLTVALRVLWLNFNFSFAHGSFERKLAVGIEFDTETKKINFIGAHSEKNVHNELGIDILGWKAGSSESRTREFQLRNGEEKLVKDERTYSKTEYGGIGKLSFEDDGNSIKQQYKMSSGFGFLFFGLEGGMGFEREYDFKQQSNSNKLSGNNEKKSSWFENIWNWFTK